MKKTARMLEYGDFKRLKFRPAYTFLIRVPPTRRARVACAFLARVLRTAGASLEGVLSGTRPASLRSYSWGS